MTDQTPTNQDLLKMFEALDVSRVLSGEVQQRQQAVRMLLLEFLEVLDSLDRMIALAEPTLGAHLETLRRQMLGTFERVGVRFFDCVGLPFDPQRHDAVETRADPSREPDTVAEVVRRGCEWEGMLLRSAQVIVVAG